MAKLVCTLEMSKERGITVTVNDAEAKITQTVSMDGETLTLKVAGEDETSTWTQTCDKISIACKDFVVEASNSISWTASKTISLESKDGDTTITSGAKLTQASKSDASLSSKTNTTIEAKSAAKLEGATVGVTAKSSLALAGKASATLEGPSVDIKADASLSAKSSGMASFEGSMTTIKGSLIKAG